jgi:hypothetical protein
VNQNKPISPPTPGGIANMSGPMKESFESGKIVATGQLQMQAAYIKLENDRFSVTKGPVINGNDMMPGFTIIEEETEEDAISWDSQLKGVWEMMYSRWHSYLRLEKLI